MSKRKPIFESLESRQLMAGDVIAFVQGGDLYIHEASGQIGQDNALTVSRMSNGAIRVSGDASGRVNGASFRDFALPSTASLIVTLGAGNDEISLLEGAAFRNVRLDLAASEQAATRSFGGTAGTTLAPQDADSVYIRGLNVGGSLTIVTGADADSVFLSDFQVGGNLSVNTGSGADTVFMQSSAGQPTSTVSGVIDVQTYSSISEANGDDVTIGSVFARQQFQVRMGGGDDVLNMNGAIAGRLMTIDMGAGADNAALRNLTVLDGLMARMGDGDDSLLVDGVYGQVNLQGEGGAGDRLRISNVPSNKLTHSGWEFINGRRAAGVIDLVNSPTVATRV